MSSSDNIKAEIVKWVQNATLPTLPNPNPNMNFYSSGEKASHWKRRSKFVREDGSVQRVFELQHGAKEIKPGMVLRAIPDHLMTVEHADGRIDITVVTSEEATRSENYRFYWE